MKFEGSSIQQLKQALATPKKVMITTHRNPDGDALGSSLGWKFFLEKKGHTVTFVTPTAFTSNLKWIQGTDTIVVCENGKDKKNCDNIIATADIIFCLDFNAITRLESLGASIAESTALKVMIDHHLQPEDFADIVFCNPQYCATSEIVYDIIADMGETDLIDQRIAECLYTGVVSDNGFFQFNNTTPNTLMVAAGLVAKGAQPDYVSDKINNVFRETRLRFFGYCLNEKLKLVNNGKVAYMMLSQAEIKKFNLQSGDNEGLVNYPFKIEGVQMSVYFSEEPDRIKISFRSRGDIDVNTFARTFFEGGGHKNASGGKSVASLADTEKKFLESLGSIQFNS